MNPTVPNTIRLQEEATLSLSAFATLLFPIYKTLGGVTTRRAAQGRQDADGTSFRLVAAALADGKNEKELLLECGLGVLYDGGQGIARSVWTWGNNTPQACPHLMAYRD